MRVAQNQIQFVSISAVWSRRLNDFKYLVVSPSVSLRALCMARQTETDIEAKSAKVFCVLCLVLLVFCVAGTWICVPCIEYVYGC